MTFGKGQRVTRRGWIARERRSGAATGPDVATRRNHGLSSWQGSTKPAMIGEAPQRSALDSLQETGAVML